MKIKRWVLATLALPIIIQAQEPESATKPGLSIGAALSLNTVSGSVRSADPEPGLALSLGYGWSEKSAVLAEGWFTSSFQNTEMSNTFFGWSLDFSGFDLFYRRRMAPRYFFFAGPGYMNLKEVIRLSRSDERLRHTGLALGGGIAYEAFSKTSNKGTNAKGYVAFKVHQYLGNLEQLTTRGPRVQEDEGNPTLFSIEFRLRLRAKRNR